MPDTYSVVIPTRLRPTMLLRAIESVAAQSRLPERVLVVDNSPEGSEADLPANIRMPITKINAPAATNAAAVRNIGLREATSRFVAFLDDDDEWLPEKMRLQLKFFEEHPDYAAVVCGRFVKSPRGVHVECPSQLALDALLDYDNFGGSFSFIVFDRSKCERLGLDTRLTAFQDWDFLLCARKFGRIGIVPQPLAVYNDHPAPRITSRLAGRRRSLQTILVKHKHVLSKDARRWVYSRILALSYQERRGTRGARQILCRSISTGAKSKFPWPLRARALCGRIVLLLPSQLFDFLKSVSKAIQVRISNFRA